MQVLVVLNNERQNDLRVMVRLQNAKLKHRVSELMTQARGRDALSLVVNQGMVENYLAPGAKLRSVPDITLIEDLL